MTKTTVGERITLALKLWDSNPAAKVRADLYDTQGKLYKQTYLFHAGDGLYLNTEEEQPDFALIATYKITNSEDYADVAEQFWPMAKVQPPSKFITGMVKSKKTQSEYITGVIK